MSAQWHPDTEALAKYQAGLAGSFRGRRLAAHVADCARCASVSDQLAAVSSVLASAPAPSLPAAAERQITAALAAEAAEAATRQATTRQTAASPAGAGPRRPRIRGFRPAMAAISAAACLLLAGLGYLLSQTGSTSGPSSASAPSSGRGAASVLEPAGRAIAPSTDLKPLEGQQRVTFTIIASGTRYQKATLGTQVRGVLNGNVSGSSGTHSEAAGHQSAASSTAGFAPSRALVGCVLHLTGNAPPRLVDRATYQGEPAYVIAVADRAWVVGLGCTASHPALITSVALLPLSTRQ